MGSVSAAMTTNSDTPRFSVFVAAVRAPRRSAWAEKHKQGPLLKAKRSTGNDCKSFTLVGTLLQLLVVSCLLDDVEDGVRQLRHRSCLSAGTRYGGVLGLERRGRRGGGLTGARTCESASG